MGRDDDIAAALPRPPFPAPARREAAIEEALRRFDGGAALPPVGTRDKSPERSSPWWRQPVRPWAGALAGAVLVALIALPLAWMSPGLQSVDEGRDPGPAAVDQATRGPAVAQDDTKPPGARVERPPPVAARNKASAPEAPDAAEAVPAPEPIQLAQAPAAPVPPGAPVGSLDRAGEQTAGIHESGSADAAGRSGSNIVVTGSRIMGPAPAPPAASRAEAPDSAVVVKSARSGSAKSAGRGDWNACTVDDPSRSLGACGKLVDPAAKGAAGRAASHLADGLERAWRDDLQGAITAFDRAIEIAPRSAFAYLNRGQAYRRGGDLDRALADLDRAVRHAPRAARFYYNRSLVLRQRGDTKRARADEERAVELDPRYAALVR